MNRRLSSVPFVQEGQPVSAAWANQLVRELRNQPAFYQPMISQNPQIKPPCAFGYVYYDEGDQFLQGGVVIGGESNTIVDPIEISETLDENDYIYLKIMCTANSGDGILLGGIKDIQSVTIENGSAIPNNKLPKMNDASGIVYVALGTFLQNKFSPFGCGNVLLSHCPGNIGYTRESYE